MPTIELMAKSSPVCRQPDSSPTSSELMALLSISPCLPAIQAGDSSEETLLAGQPKCVCVGGHKWPRLEGSVTEFLLRGFFKPESVNMCIHVSIPNPPRAEGPGVEGTPAWPLALWNFGQITSSACPDRCRPVCGQLSSPHAPGSPDCSLSLSTPKSNVCHH